MSFKVLPTSPASLHQCTGWSPWSPSEGHRWLTAIGPERAVQQFHNSPWFAEPALIDSRTGQQEQLPERLVGSQSVPAAWIAWVSESRDHVLVCREDSSLQVFKPGTSISYGWMQDDAPSLRVALGGEASRMVPTDLLAPAGSALLWPHIAAGQHQVLVLNLPSLTVRHHAPWHGGSKPVDRRPAWIAWSPCGEV